MENGINQSVTLRILGAKTTDYCCGNYAEGMLDAVAFIQFKAYGARTDEGGLTASTVITGTFYIAGTNKFIGPFERSNNAKTVQVSR
jgi:hypothetical protein